MPHRQMAYDELIAATHRVIGRVGVAQVTTRLIAEEAQVPLGSVHYWFKTKNELLGAVLTQMLSAARDAAMTSNAAGTGPDADLGTLFRAIWDSTADEPSLELATLELRLHALHVGLDGLTRRQQQLNRQLALDSSAPWREANGVELDGDWAALPELLFAVFDGLAISSLVDRDGADSERALRLFAALLNKAAAA